MYMFLPANDLRNSKTRLLTVVSSLVNNQTEFKFDKVGKSDNSVQNCNLLSCCNEILTRIENVYKRKAQ